MANYFEPTQEQVEGWQEYLEALPVHVREVAKNFYPWTLYRIKPKGHRVTLVSLDEEKSGNVSLKVRVSGEFNFLAFERVVFGIKPEDLEECGLPDKDEVLGSMEYELFPTS